MTTEIVKIQLAIDNARAAATGEAWADPNDPNVLIYDKGQRRMSRQLDLPVKAMMLSADNGPGQPKGFIKAYAYAKWSAETGRWAVDLPAGFAPWQGW